MDQLRECFLFGYTDKIKKRSLGWLIDDLICLRMWTVFNSNNKKNNIEQDLVAKHIVAILNEIKSREDKLVHHLNMAV
jgi:hypothetical protein